MNSSYRIDFKGVFLVEECWRDTTTEKCAPLKTNNKEIDPFLKSIFD